MGTGIGSLAILIAGNNRARGPGSWTGSESKNACPIPGGLILAVVVTATPYDDQKGPKAPLTRHFTEGARWLRKIWVDGSYSGRTLQVWVAQLKQTYKVVLERVESTGPDFNLVKRRWVVERTLSWLFNCRRHSKGYGRLTQNSEAMI